MPPTVVIKTAQGTAISVNGVVIDPTGAVLNNTLVYNGSAFVPGTGGAGGGILFAYQTIQTNGTPLTARSIANFTSSFTTTDNAGATRTDVDIAPTGVTPGSFTNVNLTVNSKGQITTIANGSSGIGTLATVYANGVSAASSTLLLDGTRLGLIVRDAISGISNTLLGAQTSGGAKIFDVLAGSVSTYVPLGSNIVPTYGIHNLGNGARFQALATPAAPSIAQVGTAGSTAYTYYLVAIDRYGSKTLPSPAGSTATGNAGLSVSNYNTVSWTAVPGAVAYDILKTNTTTSIGTNFAGTTFSDTGQATSVYVAPTRNNTADTIFDSRISVNGFQIDAGYTTPVAGQSLVWNATANAFIPATAGGGGGGTLASTYAAGVSSASSIMALDTTRAGVLVRDNATPIATTLFGVQNSAGSTKFLDVTTTAVQGQSFDSPSSLNLIIGGVNANNIQLGRTSVAVSVGAQINPLLDVTYTQSMGTNSLRWGAIWSLNYCGVLQTQAFSATPTFNTFLGETILITLTSNITGWSINSGSPGEIVTIIWIQDATGGRTLSGTAGNVRLAGSLYPLSSPASSRDSLTLRYDSTNLVWQEIGRGLASAAGGGGVGTLASVYANGTALASSTMVLDSTRGAIVIRDAGSSITNLLNIQNNAGSVSYFVATTSGALATGFDTITAVNLPLGTANATGITVGKSGVVAVFPGATIQVNGVLVNPGYTAPTAGQGLIYSSIAGAFIPQNQTGGGGSVSLQTAYNNGNVINLASSADVQMNWNTIGTNTNYFAMTAGNITNATAGVPQQFSGSVRFSGNAWNGVASQNSWWSLLCRPNVAGGGANINSDLVLMNSQIGGAQAEMLKWNWDGTFFTERSNQAFFLLRNNANTGHSYANNTVYTVIGGGGTYISDSTGFYPSAANTNSCGTWAGYWSNTYSQHYIAAGGTPTTEVGINYVSSATLSSNSKDTAGIVTFVSTNPEVGVGVSATVLLFTIILNTDIPTTVDAGKVPRMCLIVPYEDTFAEDFGPAGTSASGAVLPSASVWARPGNSAFGYSAIKVYLTAGAAGYTMRAAHTYQCQYLMIG